MKVTFATCFSAYFLFAAAKAGSSPEHHVSPAKRPAGYQLDESFKMNKATVKRYTRKKEKMLKGRSLSTRYLARRALIKRNQYQNDSPPQSDDALYQQPSCNQTIPATTIDLTPAEPTSRTCYPGSFQGPPQADCDVVIQAQLYNSTGSLVAYPGSVVFVTYGKCATVFQNTEESPFTFEFNWAELGETARHLAMNCLTDASQTVGGVYNYEHYLNYTLPNVMISLQRYDDRDADSPFADDTPLISDNSGSGQSQTVESQPTEDKDAKPKLVAANPAEQKSAQDPACQQPVGQQPTGDTPVVQDNGEQYYNDKSADPSPNNSEDAH